MIITIDGPAGAGKSTIARKLAERLGAEFLDTGAMYRAVAWLALEHGVPLDDPEAVAKLLDQFRVTVAGERVLVGERDISQEIRHPRVSRAVSIVANHVPVRERLVRWQRSLAQGRALVTEGRDQGTVVFPHADVKIFLTASAEERARRRVEQLRGMGLEADFATVLQEQLARDARDRNRAVGALQKAEDAIEVDTDGKSIDEVVEEIMAIVEQVRDGRNAGEPGGIDGEG